MAISSGIDQALDDGRGTSPADLGHKDSIRTTSRYLLIRFWVMRLTDLFLAASDFLSYGLRSNGF